jgi:hypothetical protein
MYSVVRRPIPITAVSPPSAVARLTIGAALVAVLVTLAVLALSPGGSLTPRLQRQQRGFAIPVYSNAGYADPQMEDYIHQIRAIGADWVELCPTWYQSSKDATKIFARSKTPSDWSLHHAIELAHKLGLKVLLKPSVDLLDGTYRGEISPSNRSGWFSSYRAFASHYAQLAASNRAEQLSIGAELSGMSTDRAGWLGVIRVVRRYYRGALTYAANFDEYQQVAFWDAVSFIAVDAYWQLAQQPTNDVAALKDAWGAIQVQLSDFAVKTGRKILFAEAGYTSERGSTTAPWSWTTSELPDESEQAAAYASLLATFSGQPWWMGVYWWAWDEPGAPESAPALSYSPRGKASEAIVRRWWGAAA